MKLALIYSAFAFAMTTFDFGEPYGKGAIHEQCVRAAELEGEWLIFCFAGVHFVISPGEGAAEDIAKWPGAASVGACLGLGWGRGWIINPFLTLA
eukprot:gene27822-33598_t